MKKCVVCKLVTFLAGVGALNWLLVSYANMNLVTALLSGIPHGVKAAYTLIGISGLITIISLIKSCPCCSGEKGSCK
ncbi:MAG: DUF378 domain-containing protein [Candidatus Omnitrophica bacterium]|nr:DUF378 domain-containing protein [Candidatus Omnitrophota bacterium]